MTIWLLLGVAVYAVGIMVPAMLLLQTIGPKNYTGPRDELPENGLFRARALRADANMRESFPVFLLLGVLSMVVQTADQATAILGAQVFVISRLLYIAVYVAGIPWIRSGVFTVSLVGLYLMGKALF